MKILALNCGSSSAKYQLYDWEKKAVLCKGIVEKVVVDHGVASYIKHEVPGKPNFKKESPCPSHKDALKLIFATLVDPERGVMKNINEINAIGHRVVHGASKFARSVRITDEVMAQLRECVALAPLHNPANIEGIIAAQELVPSLPHVGVFDTAFHQTMPEYAYLYAAPYEWYEKYGVRRYGFHGTSHLYVSKRAAVLLGKPFDQCNIITMHIGNGASHCAIQNGVSVDTSMGMTPLEGAIMGTRSGDIDPAIIPFICQREGKTPAEVENVLNKFSGLKGITQKYTDRRDIELAAEKGDARAELAIDMEAYRLKKYIGSYTAVLGRVDALVFTAGAGENGPILRDRACRNLDFIGIKLDNQLNYGAQRGKETLISAPDSRVKVFVIPTNEELVFIEDVVAILENRYDVHTKFTYSFQHPDYKP